MENLRTTNVEHLKIFDLETGRGWLQLIGIVGFSSIFVVHLLSWSVSCLVDGSFNQR